MKTYVAIQSLPFFTAVEATSGLSRLGAFGFCVAGINQVNTLQYCLNDQSDLPCLTTVVAGHRTVLLGTVTSEMTLLTTAVYCLAIDCI